MRGFRIALLLLTTLGLASGAWGAPRKAKPPISLERQPVQVDDTEDVSTAAESTTPAAPPPAAGTAAGSATSARAAQPTTPASTAPSGASSARAAPANLPAGVSLSSGYVTQIKGDVIASSTTVEPYAPEPEAGRQPDIVVQAVRVDANGNPIQRVVLTPDGGFGPQPPEAATLATDPAAQAAAEAAPPTPETESAEAEEKDSGGGFFSFLFGSDEEEAPEQAPAEEPAPEPDMYPPSRNVRIGQIVSLDEDDRFGVVWLDSRYLAFYGRELVLSRADDLTVTGAFQLTPQRNGKSVGMLRLTGTPRRGDEIILPGPQYTDYVNELYNSGQLALTREDAQQ
ncbi:MAG: hypothetical protein Q7Q73_12690 [Verrucomicrobiota bacterium JB024]|nr:hypothetical protein [Verrucomicrobiota bacterium JB024]